MTNGPPTSSIFRCSRIFLTQFLRTKLQDQLLNLSDAISLKEKNDKRIKELEAELARKKIEDAEMLQDMKGNFSYIHRYIHMNDQLNFTLLAECLRAQKQFKMASQEAAKEAKTQLKVDAHKIIKVSLFQYFSVHYTENRY